MECLRYVFRKRGVDSFRRRWWKGVLGGEGGEGGRVGGERRRERERVDKFIDKRRAEAAEGLIWRVREERRGFWGWGCFDGFGGEGELAVKVGWKGEVEADFFEGGVFLDGRRIKGVLSISSIDLLIVSTFSLTLSNLSSTTFPSYLLHFGLFSPSFNTSPLTSNSFVTSSSGFLGLRFLKISFPTSLILGLDLTNISVKYFKRFKFSYSRFEYISKNIFKVT